MPHDTEREPEFETCSLCGEEIDPVDPPAFYQSEYRVLCPTCARRIGGIYDADAETWRMPPKSPQRD